MVSSRRSVITSFRGMPAGSIAVTDLEVAMTAAGRTPSGSATSTRYESASIGRLPPKVLILRARTRRQRERPCERFHPGVGGDEQEAADQAEVFQKRPEVVHPVGAAERIDPEIMEQHRRHDAVEAEQQRNLPGVDVQQDAQRSEHLEAATEQQQQPAGHRQPRRVRLCHCVAVVEDLVQRAERKEHNETGASDERQVAIDAAHPVIPRHLWFGPIRRLGHRCTSRIACPSGSRTITARENPNAVSEIVATSGETKRTPAERSASAAACTSSTSSVVCQCQRSFAWVSGGIGRPPGGVSYCRNSTCGGASAGTIAVTRTRAPKTLSRYS